MRLSPKTIRPTLLLAALVLLLPSVPARADHDNAYGDAAYPGTGSPDDSYYDDGTPADYSSGYSYVRNLRGDATLIQADGERDQLEVNQPVLVGDRLWVAPGSLVEVLLSDGNLLRLDGGSEMVFDALAGSPESRDRATVLRLLQGNVQLVVFSDALGEEMPRVDLPNGTVYIGDAGRYRLTSDRGDWSQVVVRSGWAEVATERGSEVLRAGGEALVEGDRAPRVVLRQAGGFDTLERWGERLDAEVSDADEVAPSLRYAAAPLRDHGSWIWVGQQRAWRPTVTVGWSPYSDGRWEYTPLGLTWVSYEPWGWVPYHYGSWDLVAGFGWVWFPGRTFSPARVYWYWGPSEVAWVPYGYYQRHYRGWGFHGGFRLGVYGWVGGDWGLFADWNVCPTAYFGHRHQNRYVHDGRYWQRHNRGHAVPRGLLTTDTRGLTPNRWQRPEEALRALRTRPGRTAGTTRGGRVTADLPDVTPFVARKRDLPTDVERRILRVDDGGGARRASETPLHTVRPRDESRPGFGEIAFDGGGRSVTRREAPTGSVTEGGGARGSAPQGSAPQGSAPRGSAADAESPRVATPRAGVTRDVTRDVNRNPRAVAPRDENLRADPPRGEQRRIDARRGDGAATDSRRGAPSGSIDSTDGGPAPRPVVSPRAVEPRDRVDDAAGRRNGVLRTPPTAPRASTPRPQAPRAETPRAETPRAETPRAESPRGEVRRNGVQRNEVQRNELRRSGEAGVRPRTVILPGRATGSSDLSTSPRFRGDSTAGRSGGEIYRRSSEASPGARSLPTPPPRGERAGTRESPARRVVSGVLSDRPASRPPSDRTPTTRRPAQRTPSSRSPSSYRLPTSRRSETSRSPVVRRSSPSPSPSASRRAAPPSSRTVSPPPRRSSSSSSRGTASRRSSGSSSRSSASRSSSSRSSSSRSSRGSSHRSSSHSRGRGSGGGGE